MTRLPATDVFQPVWLVKPRERVQEKVSDNLVHVNHYGTLPANVKGKELPLVKLTRANLGLDKTNAPCDIDG